MRGLIATLHVALALSILAVQLPVTAADATTHTVRVFDFGYEDQATGRTVTHVAPGDSVLWQWDNTVQNHTVTSGFQGRTLPGPLNSPIQKGNSTYTVTFNEPGVFPYTCRLHGSMNGVVIVG